MLTWSIGKCEAVALEEDSLETVKKILTRISMVQIYLLGYLSRRTENRILSTQSVTETNASTDNQIKKLSINKCSFYSMRSQPL